MTQGLNGVFYSHLKTEPSPSSTKPTSFGSRLKSVLESALSVAEQRLGNDEATHLMLGLLTDYTSRLKDILSQRTERTTPPSFGTIQEYESLLSGCETTSTARPAPVILSGVAHSAASVLSDLCQMSGHAWTYDPAHGRFQINPK